MSDFRAHIVGDLDLSEARSQMENFLNEYKDKKLKITPEINTSQAQKAGQQAMQAVAKGVQKGNKSGDIYGFSEYQQNLREQIKKGKNDLRQAYPTLSNKDAKADAKKYYSAQESAVKQEAQKVQKQIEKTQSNISKIKSNYEDGVYDAKLSRIQRQIASYEGQDTPNVKKATSALKSYKEELSNIQNHFNGSKTLGNDQLLASFERLTKAGNQFKNTLSQIQDTQSKTLGMGVAERGANKIAAYYEANSKAVKKYGASLKELEYQYRNAKTVEDKGNIENEFSTLKSRISAEGLTGKSGLDDAKRAFRQIGQFAMTYGLIQNTVMQIPSQMISAVKDVDSSMTNLYKVTDETQSRYDQYQKSAAQSATSLGRSMSSYINQTAEWSKLGYSLDDSEKLSKLSSMYANVGEVSDDTAVSDMVTAMKAYNIKANNAQSIIDSLNILGNNYATSSADLGEGLSNSASSLAVSGNDINQSLAMLTGMAEITQSAPEAGNALKILSMRIRGYDEQTDSYTNDTEELSGAIADLTKTAKTPGGISLFTDDSKQTYKDTYTLMKDISEVYDDLTDKKKAELLEKLAGKNRGNQIAALIQGFQSGQVQRAYEDSINSEGSAQQEQDRWLNSIEAKQQQFQAAMQNLATSTISSDFFKGITDTGTGALNVLTNIVDKFGLLNTAAIGLGIFQGKNNSGESTWDSSHAFFKTTYAA